MTCLADGHGLEPKIDGSVMIHQEGTFMNIDFWESIQPSALFEAIAEQDNVEFVQQVLKKLTPDPIFTGMIIDLINNNGIELRLVVSWLAKVLHPNNYLEVGVRRGFSMAMVASRCPDVELFGFDNWIRNYVGVKNPGPRFVQSEMRKIGYEKKISFINGNSHQTLPAFFKSNSGGLRNLPGIKMITGSKSRPSMFDLIVIDGDHSILGAYQDLVDTMPYCTPGGVIVFDDIAPDLSNLDPAAIQREMGPDPHGWHNLLGVWDAIKHRFPNFRYFDYMQNPPGVGLAVRLE